MTVQGTLKILALAVMPCHARRDLASRIPVSTGMTDVVRHAIRV